MDLEPRLHYAILPSYKYTTQQALITNEAFGLAFKQYSSGVVAGILVGQK
jgi:hypothetical protein